jgi:hypothetical protein
MGEGKGKPPIFRQRLGAMSVAVFEGAKGYSVNVQRSYKREGDTDWKYEGMWFYPKHIGSIKELLGRVEEFIVANPPKQAQPQQ